VAKTIALQTQVAQDNAAKRNKIGVDDIKFAVRKDRKKLARALELIQMHDEIKNTRKAFDERHGGI